MFNTCFLCSNKVNYYTYELRKVIHPTNFLWLVLTSPTGSFLQTLGSLNCAPVSCLEEPTDSGVWQEFRHLHRQVAKEPPDLIYLRAHKNVDIQLMLNHIRRNLMSFWFKWYSSPSHMCSLKKFIYQEIL